MLMASLLWRVLLMLALMRLLLYVLLLASLLLPVLVLLFVCLHAIFGVPVVAVYAVVLDAALSCYLHTKREYGTGRPPIFYVSHLVHPPQKRTLTELPIPSFFYARLFGILSVWYRKGENAECQCGFEKRNHVWVPERSCTSAGILEQSKGARNRVGINRVVVSGRQVT
jgi:hypothetical protein